MNMSKRLVVVAILALGTLLAACGPATTPATESPAYPAPELEGYPVPAQVDEPFDNPYPGPSEGVTIYSEWSVAETAILNGQVEQIFQASTFHVTLVLKDGSVILAKEPALDEVLRLIERCGDPCQGLEVTDQ
jgi:hypothetical protein